MAHLGPIDLQVNASEIICVSGASGSGKSLLLRAIADIIPHAGRVSLNQQDATSMSAPLWRRQVGLLPAENQWWRDEVSEHFSEQDDDMLEALGFRKECWQWHVANCSTGEKQRLSLLRLLSIKPKCLLLDEPTASLDPESTQRVETVIQQYRTSNAIPVIWVSHSPEQIARICTRHYKVVDGRLVQQ